MEEQTEDQVVQTPVEIAVVEKDGTETVPNFPIYLSQEKLIQQYWINKKMEKVTEGITASQFDIQFKQVFIEEAKLLYPRKGMYKVVEGTEGKVVEFLGKI